MKILLATETLHAGGAETFVVRLANMLCEKHDVAIVVYYKNIVNSGVISQLSPKVKTYFIDITSLPIKQKADSLLRKLNIDHSYVQNAIQKKVAQVIKDFQPDIVHSHLFKADYVIANIKKTSTHPFKHVTTIHGDYSSFYNKEVDARMLNIQNKITDTLSAVENIVCLCEEHQMFFTKNFPETTKKLALIYNGYQPANNNYKTRTKIDLKLPENEFLFGMVSRGVEKKGWKKAIDAFIEAELPNATLVLVGSGDYLDKLAQETKHPKILFPGFSSIPVEYIQHFDVCLLPTLFHYESLPTVVMEYLYCNKPVIATNVGEIRKMITDSNKHEAGDLLEFKDFDISIALFAALMSNYYSSETYLNEKKKYTQDAFIKFDMNHCALSYLGIYRS